MLLQPIHQKPRKRQRVQAGRTGCVSSAVPKVHPRRARASLLPGARHSPGRTDGTGICSGSTAGASLPPHGRRLCQETSPRSPLNNKSLLSPGAARMAVGERWALCFLGADRAYSGEKKRASVVFFPSVLVMMTGGMWKWSCRVWIETVQAVVSGRTIPAQGTSSREPVTVRAAHQERH